VKLTSKPAFVPALLCALLGFSWQCLTVHFNYGGNFTALFCTGSRFPTPPELAGERIYVFPNSGGYDGQSYHYVAHDPLCRTGIGRAVPDPQFRFPRILLPGLAHLVALGRPQWIDASYFACNLLFLYLGAWWLAQLLIAHAGQPDLRGTLRFHAGGRDLAGPHGGGSRPGLALPRLRRLCRGRGGIRKALPGPRGRRLMPRKRVPADRRLRAAPPGRARRSAFAPA
jgi:hypothetical protein